MMREIVLGVFSGICLAACVSAKQENYAAFSDTIVGDSGTIMFYREDSAQAKFAHAYLGTRQGYFLALDERQYASISVPAGFNELKVKAQGSRAFAALINVNAGETVCIRTRPNHEDLEWLVVPFLNALIPSFVMEETPCPNVTAMANVSSEPK